MSFSLKDGRHYLDEGWQSGEKGKVPGGCGGRQEGVCHTEEKL